MNSTPPSTSSLARNTILTILGQIFPLVVGVLTIPFVVNELGPEQFGLLSFVWVLLGYFTIFDLGLGRATTKFVAEEIGRGNQESLPGVVWTAVLIQACLGIVGAVVLILLTPVVVTNVLSIPVELQEDARMIFYFVSFVIPVILVTGSFRGVLEASQRFDLISIVRVIFGSFNFLLPALGLMAGIGLVNIVGLLILGWVGMGATILILNLRTLPSLRQFHIQRQYVSVLFSFGSWVTITSIATPVYQYIERLAIASVSVGLLTYYAVPFEMISRLAILPAGIATTLFPAFSYYGSQQREKIQQLLAKPFLYLLFILGPIVVVCTVFGFDILRLWLDEEFAMRSVEVFQILSVAMLFHAFAHIPYAAVHGFGRPAIKAKFDLLMMPIFTGLCFWLVPEYGIVGAAYAKFVLMLGDFLFLSVTARRLSGLSWNEILGARVVRAISVVACFAILVVGLWMLSLSLLVTAMVLLGLVAVYVAFSFSYVFDEADRLLFLGLARSFGVKGNKT